MSNLDWAAHTDRLRAATLGKFTRSKLPAFIEKHTYLKGEQFSWEHHEYALGPISDEAKVIVVTKPSQVGMSETLARFAVARAAITPMNVLYIMPSFSAAQDFAKGRVNEIIQTSPYLSSIVDRNIDNVSVKKLGHSYLYFKGAQKDSQAISTPGDVLICDEYNFASEVVVKQFQSRLNHSKIGEKWFFSTPTLPGMGVSAMFDEAIQRFRMVKCIHCGEWSWPDLPNDIRIPGHPNIDWPTLTKAKLEKIDYSKAYIACPKCGLAPDYSHQHREWVIKNPETRFETSGWAVSPMDVPFYRTAVHLVRERVEYGRYTDWLNTACGLPHEDADSGLSREELDECFIDQKPGSGWFYVIGMDMGMECWTSVWGVSPDGMMVMVHLEAVPVGRLFERKEELCRKYRTSIVLCDAFPYTESIMRLQASDPNVYAGVYTRTKNVELYSLKKYDEKPEAGRELVRQVNINRDPAFDGLMAAIRAGEVKFAIPEMKEIIIAHLMDMKRVKEYSDVGEMRYTWVKSSKGEDHIAHSTLYAFIAARIRGVAENIILLPTTSLFTFRQKPVQT